MEGEGPVAFPFCCPGDCRFAESDECRFADSDEPGQLLDRGHRPLAHHPATDVRRRGAVHQAAFGHQRYGGGPRCSDDRTRAWPVV
jgi:hypothetical protein